MRRYGWERTPEETIARLKEELYKARRTIMELVPEKLREYLQSYWNCKSRKDTYGWLHHVSEEIIKHAKIIPFDEQWGSERAYCPLCGAGSLGPYQEGYAYPEGLRRHLTGYGRTHECSVIYEVHHLAMDYWDEAFAKQEQLEREEAAALLKARRESEPLYLVGPNSYPKLIDEIVYPKESIRDEKQLKQSEALLHDLGFTRKTEGSIVSYVLSAGGLFVFANPLQQKTITFCACRESVKNRSNARCHRFSFSDKQKKDIASELKNNLDAAKSALKIQ